MRSRPRPELSEALTDALNRTLPAVLRCRSAESYQQLHSYALYEQWYNAEVIMHLRREVQGSCYDGDWVRVRGEAPLETKARRADWAIVPWDSSNCTPRCFDANEVYAFGETKVVGLGAAGYGTKSEAQKIITLGEQTGKDTLRSCLCFAHLILPCWGRKKTNLTDASLESLAKCAFPAVRDTFDLEIGLEHVQCILGWFGHEEAPDPTMADAEFALTQLLLRRPADGGWEVVMPPQQHQLSAYLTAKQNKAFAAACC